MQQTNTKEKRRDEQEIRRQEKIKRRLEEEMKHQEEERINYVINMAEKIRQQRERRRQEEERQEREKRLYAMYLMEVKRLEKEKRRLKQTTQKCGCIIIQNGFILLVEQVASKMFGIPKGKKYSNETPQDCAIRETKEETGFEVDTNFVKLGSLAPSLTCPY